MTGTFANLLLNTWTAPGSCNITIFVALVRYKQKPTNWWVFACMNLFGSHTMGVLAISSYGGGRGCWSVLSSQRLRVDHRVLNHLNTCHPFNRHRHQQHHQDTNDELSYCLHGQGPFSGPLSWEPTANAATCVSQWQVVKVARSLLLLACDHIGNPKGFHLHLSHEVAGIRCKILLRVMQ